MLVAAGCDGYVGVWDLRKKGLFALSDNLEEEIAKAYQDSKQFYHVYSKALDVGLTDIEKLKNEVYERELARLLEINRIARIAERKKRIDDYNLRMDKKKELAKQEELKALADAPAFTQDKINKWIADIMKIIEDEDSLITLYTKLTGKRPVEIMDLIKSTHIVVPDVIAFLGRAITNQDWLKELHIRFLDFAYSGIKSFTMEAIKPLFSFVIVQLYIKSNNNNYENLDKLVGLFVCTIKLIQKLGIVIELEDYSTIEYNWNAGLYEMWN